MGVWKVHRELRQIDLGDGWFPLLYRHRVERACIAVRLVHAIQTGRAIRFQHRDDQDVGARSCERIAARVAARLPVARAGSENYRMDWHELVALGCRDCRRVSIAPDADRTGSDHAALQQIYAATGGSVTPAPFRTGAARRFSYTQHRGDGR